MRSSAVAAGFSHADSLFHTSQTKANGGIASPCQHTRSLAGRRGGGAGGNGPSSPTGGEVGGRSHRREVVTGRGSPEEILEGVLRCMPPPLPPRQVNKFPKLWVWLSPVRLFAAHAARKPKALPTRDSARGDGQPRGAPGRRPAKRGPQPGQGEPGAAQPRGTVGAMGMGPRDGAGVRRDWAGRGGAQLKHRQLPMA